MTSLDRHHLVDPEVAEAIAKLPLDFSLSREILPLVREGIRSMAQAPPLSDAVERVDHEVPAQGDEPAITVRVHTPKSLSGPAPCVYWMHGGGLVMGSYEMEDARFDAWCQQLGLVGVAVEYRLAPEVPYPGPIEDCYRGLSWVHAHAERLGVDPARVGIGGASAGGGLAAALALLARDRGKLPVAFQLLVYPMLDDRQITPSSGWEVPVWTPASNDFGWRSYLGDAKGGPDVPPYAAAARATDLAGLPPALVTVGAVDGFVDENIDYAQRLNQAGVPTQLHVYPGGAHGFDGLAAAAPLARRARQDMEDWLAAQLGG